MTFNDVQFSWIPFVRNDNSRYITRSKAAEGLSAIDIWNQPWATPDDLRVCWDAYQQQLMDKSLLITHFLIRTEPINEISRTRLYLLRKNIAQMTLSASVSKFIDLDGIMTYEKDADFITAAMPLLRGISIALLDDFLRQMRGFYLIAIEQENLNLLQRLIETKLIRPPSGYDFPDALLEFLKYYPAIGVGALGWTDDREKSVIAIGNMKTLKKFMNPSAGHLLVNWNEATLD